MQLFKLEKEIENVGEAQQAMRLVIQEIEKGQKKGDGWMIGEGDIEHKPEIRAKLLNPMLEDFAQHLQELRRNGELTHEKLKNTNEEYLVFFLDLLVSEGYGLQKGADSSEIKPSEEIKKEPEDTTTPTETAPENASQPLEVPEGIEGKNPNLIGKEGNIGVERKSLRFPWEKKN